MLTGVEPARPEATRLATERVYHFATASDSKRMRKLELDPKRSRTSPDTVQRCNATDTPWDRSARCFRRASAGRGHTFGTGLRPQASTAAGHCGHPIGSR